MAAALLTRRAFMLTLAAGSVLIRSPARALSPREICGAAGSATDGLWEKACKRNILFGSAVNSADLTVPAYAELVAEECAVLTPASEMTWAALQPRPGEFSFDAPDRIAAFARSHSMALRGHCLVWHQGLPAWLTSTITSRNWQDLLSHHMEAVIGHYRGQVFSWDVVNEAVEPAEGRPDGLRNSPWLKNGGNIYPSVAFKLAAQFAPDARLVYNEYGCEHETEAAKKRRAAVLKLIETLKKDGAPLHGLGLQSHLRVGDPFNPASFGKFLAEVKALGVTPLITEFDVRADRVHALADKDRSTATLAKSYLDVVMAAGCDLVVCWGLSDDRSSRAVQEADDRPLPFDRRLGRKSLYDAIQAAITGSSS